MPRHGSNIPMPTEKSTQVSEQISRLEESSTELVELSEKLEARLQSVLRQENEPKTGAVSTEIPLVSLAEGIRYSGYRIEDVAQRMRRILDRLEL